MINLGVGLCKFYVYFDIIGFILMVNGINMYVIGFICKYKILVIIFYEIKF